MKTRIDIKAILSGIFLSLAAAYVFYNRIFGLIPASAVGIYGYRVVRNNNKERERIIRLSELKSMMISFQSSLAAGKSMESTVHMARNDLSDMYGKKNSTVMALERIEGKLQLRYTLERCLEEFAKEIDLREADDFAIVISTIKRTGGNAVKVLKDAVERIVSEIELREELATVVAAKRLELAIMVYMPAAICLFLRITNKGFLDPLYTGIPGIIIMTIIMVINIGADYMGRRIVNIV
jgi:tight adherence protein B